jgi:hypothetical protein
MARKPTNIDTFAEILIEDLPASLRPCPGEMTYVAVGARLIQEKLREYYKNAGLEPPQFQAIRNWFYYGSPDWAIAVLHNILGAKVNAGNLVSR